MNRQFLATAIAMTLLGGATLNDGLLAKGPPTGGEGEGNRLSYPVILPENQAPSGFPSALPWTFAEILDPATECTLGAPPDPVPIPQDRPCYYDGAQVWWLAQRTANYWKAFSFAPATDSGPVLVTAVDVGDLLESSPNLNLRRVRTEIMLYQNAQLDPRFSQYLPESFPAVYPFDDDPPCLNPTTGGEIGCLGAFSMSDAVPGTEQSINEIQGTDFGTNTADGSAAHASATATLLDPSLVKSAVAEGGVAIPVHATVYSNCARLVIQQLGVGIPSWNPVAGIWNNAAAPVVNVATYADLGAGGMYSAEINASGTLIYGYNWNATRDNNGPGVYRLTFVLDGPPRCASLNAEFDDAFVNPDGTYVVNRGEVANTTVIPRADERLNGGTEGGLAYIDVNIVKKGAKPSDSRGGGRGAGGGAGGGGGQGGPR